MGKCQGVEQWCGELVSVCGVVEQWCGELVSVCVCACEAMAWGIVSVEELSLDLLWTKVLGLVP